MVSYLQQLIAKVPLDQYSMACVPFPIPNSTQLCQSSLHFFADLLKHDKTASDSWLKKK